MSIEVRNLSKTFGHFRALNDVSLRVETGELVALLGPSGSGKTTLLRLIGGLEAPDPSSGPILFHDEDYSAKDVGKRGVGFVFQHYALFRHMTVFENVAFGLRSRPWRHRPARAEIRRRVTELLELVQLQNLARRYPSQLSGGQRQRVALARALAAEPKVLLLDEPFGALDATVRRELRRWLRKLHDEIHITTVFVTHDQEEALEVADRIAVMNHGRIEQVGTPEDVYEHPANAFVYKFLGSVNLFHGRLDAGGRLTLRAAGAPPQTNGANEVDQGAPDRQAVAYVRPHEIELSRHRNGRPVIGLRVKHVTAAGPLVRLYAEPDDGGDPVEVELSRERYTELRPQVGEQVFAHLTKVRVFEEDYSI